MKKNDKVIIYDDACPLCAAYTNGFVKSGMIEANNRKNFSSIDAGLLALIDPRRSTDEIPLIDANTKQVWYGMDALLEILGQRFKWIKTIGQSPPVKWLLVRLYRLISYNRRVIVATTKPAGNFDCTPRFNVKYRLGFMFIFLLFNSLMLLPLHEHILQHSFFSAGFYQLQWAHFAIVGTNILIAARLPKQAGIEYLGQVNMLALTVVLLLVPLMLLNSMFSNLYDLNNFYLGALSLFTIMEYRRRMKYAKLFTQYRHVVWINAAALTLFLLYLNTK